MKPKLQFTFRETINEVVRSDLVKFYYPHDESHAGEGYVNDFLEGRFVCRIKLGTLEGAGPLAKEYTPEPYHGESFALCVDVPERGRYYVTHSSFDSGVKESRS